MVNYNDGNVDKKFQPSILSSSQENCIFLESVTDWQLEKRTDIVNYRVFATKKIWDKKSNFDKIKID